MVRVQVCDQAACGRARVGLGLADHDVYPVAEAKPATVAPGALAHVVEQPAEIGDPLGPHQEHVGFLRGRFARGLGEAAEVEQRRAAGTSTDAGRLEFERKELAFVRDALPVEQPAQDLHALPRASVARLGGERGAGQIARDDVDREPSVEHAIQGGQLARQLRRPEFTATDRDQQTQPLEQRRHAAREGHAVDAERIARGAEDVVEAVPLRLQHDIAAVWPGASQFRVLDPEFGVVVVAERTEPGDFHRAHRA